MKSRVSAAGLAVFLTAASLAFASTSGVSSRSEDCSDTITSFSLIRR